VQESVQETPRWFHAALADAPEHADTTVDGAKVHLRCWGAAGRPGLVLVHGGAAHSGWWDHVAPFFAGTHRVVALDLSGHGDSGRRQAYGMDGWAAEVVAAAAAGGITSPPLVVGHSMGGWVAVTAGVRHGAELDGIAIIDSPLVEPPPEEEVLRRRQRGTRTYPTREEILARFTTLPPQDVVLPYVREHIAAQSVRRVEGGWTWKFDPALFAERPPLRDLLPMLRCRAAYIRSEFGLVPPEMAGTIDELLGHRVPIVELPDAGHHPMLDQPLPLVTALRMLMQQWALR
jgi:pimeloyl-ACP methyl ester carboxylesterase